LFLVAFIKHSTALRSRNIFNIAAKPMNTKLLLILPFAAFSLTQCIVEVPSESNGTATQLPTYGQPLTAQTGPGTVTILEGSRVVTTIRTASPNVERTYWQAEQEQIVTKSRGNHGPATVELFNSRSGAKLGTVMAYDAANGPAWARSMAE
jgi:adenosylmethionine-8-amino-7-oxononanoate aminotransferase